MTKITFRARLVRTLLWAVVFVIAAVAAGWLINRMGWMNSASHTNSHATASTDAERKVLYWYDPMYPTQHFDAPGPSPFMDMDLVPKYASDADQSGGEASEAGVQISPQLQQNLGVRTVVVERRQPTVTEQVWTGQFRFDDRNRVTVQTRDLGFVERVYPYRVGDRVAAGAPLVEVLIPSWLAAQQEYLVVLGMNDAALTRAAQQRLRLLGMSAAQIQQLTRTRKTQAIQQIRSPSDGVLTDFSVQTGMTVAQGQTLATLVSHDPVWLEVSIPERDSSRVQVGDRFEVKVPALNRSLSDVRIDEILPSVDGNSRSVIARARVANPTRQLKDGLFAQVRHTPEAAASALWVSDQAIIRTEQRTVLMVQRPDGSFEPRSVQLGQSVGDDTEVISGIDAGEKVVVSGQFLIDSEANLQGVLDRMNVQRPTTLELSESHPKSHAQSSNSAKSKKSAASTAPPRYQTTATVKGIQLHADPSQTRISVQHAAIAELGWPEMTMGFAVAAELDVSALRAGDRVQIEIMAVDDDYRVTSIQPIKDEVRR